MDGRTKTSEGGIHRVDTGVTTSEDLNFPPALGWRPLLRA